MLNLKIIACNGGFPLIGDLVRHMIEPYQRYSQNKDVFSQSFHGMWNADETTFSVVKRQLKDIGKNNHLLGVSVDSCLQLATIEGISRVTIVSLTDELLWIQLPFYLYLFSRARNLQDMKAEIFRYYQMDKTTFNRVMFKLCQNGPFDLKEYDGKLESLFQSFKTSLLDMVLSFKSNSRLWMESDYAFKRVRELVLRGAIVPAKLDLLRNNEFSEPVLNELKADVVFLSNITGSVSWNQRLSQTEIAIAISQFLKPNSWVVHTPKAVAIAIAQSSESFSAGEFPSENYSIAFRYNLQENPEILKELD